VTNQSKSQHITELAKELLDDIELSRIQTEALLLKTSRLARLMGTDEIRNWIWYEMHGYNNSDPISLKYMGLTGRWVDKTKNIGYWGPLSTQEALLIAEKAKLSAMRTPDVSGEYMALALAGVNQAMSTSVSNIAVFSGIKSRTLALLHRFVSGVYYEKHFDKLSESIFEKYKSGVDNVIANKCGDILQKLPSVMDRLSDGDSESIRQALVTCRVIIDNFADSIFPPTNETIDIGGNILKLDSSKHQNRINVYVHLREESKSRKQKIRQNLANLYDRLSTGVHAEVTVEEARSLLLNTYLILGEILHIKEKIAQQGDAPELASPAR
jgi:AbiTii